MSYSKFVKSVSDFNDVAKSEKKSETVVIGERCYTLNKSKTKFVSVCLSRDFGYEPCVTISGNKGNLIVFNEEEWKKLLDYQGIIMNYLCTNDIADPIRTTDFSVNFEQFSSKRVVKIWKNYSYMYLGFESITKLWDLLKIVQFRLEILKRQKFASYYEVLRQGLQNRNGNIFDSAAEILYDTYPTENICLALELLHNYPDIFEADCRK